MKLINEKLKKEYYSYLVSAVKRAPEKKFILFGQGRSGSTLLIDLLNSHPKISAHKEILNTSSSAGGNVVPFRYPYRYVKGIAARCESEVYGYKTKIYQVEGHNVKPEIFLDKHVQEGWTIIYLWRENILKQAISGEKAAKTDIWHQRKKDANKVKIKLNPSNIIERIKFRKNVLEREKDIIEGINHIEVIYERDLLIKNEHQNVCNKIFERLNLRNKKVSTSLRKMDRVEIENIGEIKNKANKEMSGLKIE